MSYNTGRTLCISDENFDSDDGSAATKFRYLTDRNKQTNRSNGCSSALSVTVSAKICDKYCRSGTRYEYTTGCSERAVPFAADSTATAALPWHAFALACLGMAWHGMRLYCSGTSTVAV